MRILHILDHSLPLHSGYTFRTRAIMRAQRDRGWTVAGVTGVRHSAAGPDAETIDDLTFFRTEKPAPARSPMAEWREITALAAKLATLVEQWRPDILHAHSPVLTALAALKVKRRDRLPLVYEIRAFWEDAAVGNGTGHEGSLKYRVTRALEGYAARQVDAVAVICEGLRADLIARGISAEKLFVSPNGVDLTQFGDPPPRDDALGAQLKIARGDDVIGFIGSFYDYEGLNVLIAAMPAIVAARPSVQLLLVGGGPLENELRAQAAASPASANIHFIGRVPHDQVDRYYSLIDVMVYPRKKMRLTDLVTPLKPLEAMAQRRLVAASDVGGHRELIEHGVTGTLFAPDDPGSTAREIIVLLDNRDRWPERIATARAFVERERNWSSNISRYEAVYDKLLSHRQVTS